MKIWDSVYICIIWVRETEYLRDVSVCVLEMKKERERERERERVLGSSSICEASERVVKKERKLKCYVWVSIPISKKKRKRKKKIGCTLLQGPSIKDESIWGLWILSKQLYQLLILLLIEIIRFISTINNCYGIMEYGIMLKIITISLDIN